MKDKIAEIREKIVMFAMTAAVVAVLGWLLIPAKGIIQYTDKDSQRSPAASSAWKKPDSDQQYPVLGEVFPESPITADGVLLILKATDVCNVRLVAEDSHEQTHVLRMLEPWKLRVRGSFALFLDNAGVVAVEIAGIRIQHGAGIGQHWTGSFDAQGNWLRPLPRPAPPKVEIPDDILDDDAGNSGGNSGGSSSSDGTGPVR